MSEGSFGQMIASIASLQSLKEAEAAPPLQRGNTLKKNQMLSSDSSEEGPESLARDTNFFQGEDGSKETKQTFSSPRNVLLSQLEKSVKDKLNIARLNDKTFMQRNQDGFIEELDLVHN